MCSISKTILKGDIEYITNFFKNNKFVFLCDCEIYNFNELKKKYNLNVFNSSDLLFELFKKNYKNPKKIFSELNGDYSIAFFYLENDFIKGFLTRDIFGIRPLWYYYDKTNFYFSLEKKLLPKKFVDKAIDLNPRILLDFSYNITTKKLKIKELYKKFFSHKFIDVNYDLAKKNVEKLLKKSVELRLENNVAILISGDRFLLIGYYSK